MILEYHDWLYKISLYIYGITLLSFVFFSVPIIELKGHTFIVDEGKSVAIECNINYEQMCCQPFWERINENDETNKLTIREDKKDKYFGLKRDPPCLTILNAEMSDGGYYCCCIEYSTSNGEETVRSKKAHLIVEEGMHKLYIYNIRHPSYKAIYHMHWDSKDLLNCPPQERPPLLWGHFFITEVSAL